MFQSKYNTSSIQSTMYGTLTSNLTHAFFSGKMRHLQLKYMVYSICAHVHLAVIFVLFGFCKLSTFLCIFFFSYKCPLDWVYWLYSHYRRWYCYDFSFMLTQCATLVAILLNGIFLVFIDFVVNVFIYPWLLLFVCLWRLIWLTLTRIESGIFITFEVQPEFAS